jgi:amino acid permease
MQFYEETEVWFASLKVIMMIGLLIPSLILFWDGGRTPILSNPGISSSMLTNRSNKSTRYPGFTTTGKIPEQPQLGCDLYISSRPLYPLAVAGNVPKIFTKCTRHGVPYNAVIAAALFSPFA